MIQCEDLVFRHATSIKDDLDHINLHIRPGEFILLTGMSGSGKSTLTRCINGVIPHFIQGSYAGKVQVAGESVYSSSLHQIGRTVGSVFQDPRSQFFATTVQDELVFGCENYGFGLVDMQRRLSEVIEHFSLADVMPRGVFNLSGGERQRVALASVAMMSPAVYVLDEPSSNLDVVSIRLLADMLQLLKAEGSTILIAEHRFSYLHGLVDRVIYMREGSIEKQFAPEEWWRLSSSDRKELGLREAQDPQLLMIKKEKRTGGRAFDCELYVKELSFRYRNLPVLQSVTFQAKVGDVIGIMGNNGTGKSTLCQILCGLKREKEGRVYWNGQPLGMKQRRKWMFVVFQDCEFQLFAGSVEDELRLGNEKTPKLAEKVEHALQALSITELRTRHPATLSGGQKQRVSIASALVRDTPILMFDEPTSGMDGHHMRQFAELLQRLSLMGKLVIVVTHDREFIGQACNRVLHLQDGVLEEFELNEGG